MGAMARASALQGRRCEQACGREEEGVTLQRGGRWKGTNERLFFDRQAGSIVNGVDGMLNLHG
jgi:hypothetical protein